jgi:hypothetical protein
VVVTEKVLHKEHLVLDNIHIRDLITNVSQQYIQIPDSANEVFDVRGSQTGTLVFDQSIRQITGCQLPVETWRSSASLRLQNGTF